MILLCAGSRHSIYWFPKPVSALFRKNPTRSLTSSSRLSPVLNNDFFKNRRLAQSQRGSLFLGWPSLVLVSRHFASGKGYSNYGHQRLKPGDLQYFSIYFTAFGFALGMLLLIFTGGDLSGDGTPRQSEAPKPWKVQAATLDHQSSNKDNRQSDDENANDDLNEVSETEEPTDEAEVDAQREEAKKKKKRKSFRDRKIIEYENRIRTYSTPDKIFRYFATLKVYPENEQHQSHNYEIFMTPEDFVRSITPGVIQPEGLRLDQFRTFDPRKENLNLKLSSDSIFHKLGEDCLISFTDYIFLLTVLSTSPRHFALAFKMFDLNGDGQLDYQEFEKVESVIRSQTSVGARHRDHASTGSMLKRSVNSALAAYFFGPELQGKLTIEKFLDFQEQLQRDILQIEFQRRKPAGGKISEVAFATLLLQHSGLPEKRQHRMLQRVKKQYCKKKKEHKHEDEKKEDEQKEPSKEQTAGIIDLGSVKEVTLVPMKSQGVSYEELKAFFDLLADVTDVDTALTFYHMAGASVDRATLQHVAKTVAGVEISDHVTDIVFTLFDENQDGELSNREFVAVMKRRLMRGLEHPKDTGFFRLMTAAWQCSWERTPHT